MPGRLSIFSFDTLVGRPRLSANFAWLAGILVGTRLLMAGTIPDLTAYGNLVSAAEYLRTVHDDGVRVVFFGSSRLWTAIVAQEWARRSGLRPDQVLNLAINDGRLSDELYMLRRAGGLPQSVRLVVIEVAPWEFNRDLLNPANGDPISIPERARSLATLSERLAVDDIATRLKLLGDFIWPVYQRRPLLQWHFGGEPAKPTVPPPPPIHVDKKARDYLAALDGFKGENIQGMHFHNASISEYAKRNLDALIERVQGKSRQIVLLWLPARVAYVRPIEADPQKHTFYREVQDFVRAHTSEDVVPVIWDVAADCGLHEDVFVDYGHFSLEGASAFTDRLYDELASRRIVVNDR